MQHTGTCPKCSAPGTNTEGEIRYTCGRIERLDDGSPERIRSCRRSDLQTEEK